MAAAADLRRTAIPRIATWSNIRTVRSLRCSSAISRKTAQALSVRSVGQRYRTATRLECARNQSQLRHVRARSRLAAPQTRRAERIGGGRRSVRSADAANGRTTPRPEPGCRDGDVDPLSLRTTRRVRADRRDAGARCADFARRTAHRSGRHAVVDRGRRRTPPRATSSFWVSRNCRCRTAARLQRRPYAMWLSGIYPKALDGLCKALSLDMRVIDPAWIAKKLRELQTYAEPKGDFFAPVPDDRSPAGLSEHDRVRFDARPAPVCDARHSRCRRFSDVADGARAAIRPTRTRARAARPRRAAACDAAKSAGRPR